MGISTLFSRRRLRFWLMAAGILVCLLLCAELVQDVFYDPQEGDLEALDFDQALMRWAQAYRSSGLTQVMTDLTALGSFSVITVLFLVMASVQASYKDYRGLAYLTSVLSGAAVWPTLLKLLFQRERPVEVEHLVRVTDFSFPSGHAFGAAALYVALAYYSGRYARSWTQELFFYFLGALLIFLVGVTRIYLGVHYPTDVLAGIFGGVAWGLAVSAGFEWFRPAAHKE